MKQLNQLHMPARTAVICKLNLVRLEIPHAFRAFLIWLLIFAAVKTLSAQPGKIQKPVFKFQHVNRELSNNQVFCVFQDRSGFFWIGTLGGLHRFKGEDYDLFVTSKDSSSIHDSRVEKLFQDKNGNLWIGTHNGLSRYNPDKNNFVRYETENKFVDPTDPNTNRIRDIVEDGDGKLWVASLRTGLSWYNEQTKSFVPFFSESVGNTLGTTNITALCPDKAGILWIGTLHDGLKKLNTKTNEVIHFRHDPKDPSSIAGNYIASIVVDRSGTVWVGTNYWGVDRLGDGSATKFIHYKQDRKSAV